MSAVFEAVADVVETVVDAVGDVVEVVSDAVETVVDTVATVVEAVANDPLPVLLSVAGSFVGIPPYVTMGAITAARGGDLEDIALSMGTAYIGAEFAPGISNTISSTVSSTFVEAGFNEVFSQVASDSISKGLVNGTMAEIKGGSFEDGFAGGFVGGMVQGGVGEVASFVKDDVIDLAMENGLDLKDATSVYNASVKAVSAGVTSEVTGKNDFVTSFTNSAIGSGINSGVNSLNATIDEQFASAATDWNEKDKEGTPIDVAITGAGIPDDVVSQVQVSDIGVDATPDTNTIDTANVLAETVDDANRTNNIANVGETATSDISVLPETALASAPTGETVTDFADTTVAPITIEEILANTANQTKEVPENLVDIASTLPSSTETVAEPVGGLTSVAESVIPTNEAVEPKGGLTTIAESTAPVVDMGDVATTAAVSEAPVSENLLTSGLVQEPPVGGLNTVAQATPQDKMASSMGFKPTDITKPLVATMGSMLKSAVKQGSKPAAKVASRPPTGGLQMAGATVKKPTAPPAKMDISKLIPIQKATTTAPAKTLASGAKLSPVTNIAGLTSLLKKTG
tara:strand:+ start:699 stop:2417 length:1719 start_codon:yes stop_codon:yes gene_type:complete